MKKKRQSKRQSLHDKYKIRKKVHEHNRKAKRLERITGATQHASHKDPGIPNLCPYKAQLLAQMEERQQRLDDQKEDQKRKRKEAQAKMRAEGQDALSEMRTQAAARGAEFEKKEEEMQSEDASFIKAMTGKHSKAVSANRKQFFQELRKVVANSDIILEVLDARDPLGSRSPQLEEYVNSLNKNKRIVLILNKIDLVPREVVRGWIAYLSQEYPTVAFKSVTAASRARAAATATATTPAAPAAAASEAPAAASVTHAESLGGDTLIHLLKSYARSHNIMTHVTVGVVGYPNVGKSSLINSLKRTKAVTVSSVPGTTTHMQSVQLDQKVALLDCPGVIFGSSNMDSDVLRNALRVEKIEDPISPVSVLVKRVSPATLMTLYKTPLFETAEELLGHVARHLGKLKRGGLPDLNAAARQVLHDWNDGRIPFFTPAPAMPAGTKPGEATPVSGTTLVAEFAPEFDLNGLQETNLVCQLPEAASMGPMVALPPTAAAAPMEEEHDEGEDDEEEHAKLSADQMIDVEDEDEEDEEADEDEEDEEADQGDEDEEGFRSADPFGAKKQPKKVRVDPAMPTVQKPQSAALASFADPATPNPFKSAAEFAAANAAHLVKSTATVPLGGRGSARPKKPTKRMEMPAAPKAEQPAEEAEAAPAKALKVKRHVTKGALLPSADSLNPHVGAPRKRDLKQAKKNLRRAAAKATKTD